MSYQVQLVQDAEDDLYDLYQYVVHHDSPTKAERLLDNLYNTCASLTELPERGYIPPELDRIGLRTFHEIHFKPYRVIYLIEGKKVFVHAVLDGRRDLRDLLQQRLLR